MKKSEIESYNTNEDSLIKDEKIILSVDGEKRAELLSKKDELQNLDVIYCSNCVRTLQTAKYFFESQNLKINIDERLDERRTGIPNDDVYPDWFIRQYVYEDFKTEGGESQREVRDRVDEVFTEILSKYKNKRIAIFSHGYAITFFLLKYCKLISIEENKIKYEYNGKIVFDKAINAPEVFKMTLDDNDNVTNIEVIDFDDIPYNRGV